MDEFVKYYSSETLGQLLSYKELIPVLRTGFTKEFLIPPRMHLNYEDPSSDNLNTLLLMPAINVGKAAGVKIVSVNPDNSKRNLPSIQGIYYLFDPQSGSPIALIDAKSLTNWRTAATSALASSFLASKSSKKMLMIGTGSLASYLIDAHSEIHPIEEVMIWGRSHQKAETFAEQQNNDSLKISVAKDLREAVKEADIVSVATLSKEPLIKGTWLRPGQHIDLVGAYRPDMREADDETMLRSEIFVDSIEMAPKESGDLSIPISENVIQLSDIKGDLFQLCKSEVAGRISETEITLFKSVGHALEDLVAAQLITQLVTDKSKNE